MHFSTHINPIFLLQLKFDVSSSCVCVQRTNILIKCWRSLVCTNLLSCKAVQHSAILYISRALHKQHTAAQTPVSKNIRHIRSSLKSPKKISENLTRQTTTTDFELYLRLILQGSRRNASSRLLILNVYGIIMTLSDK